MTAPNEPIEALRKLVHAFGDTEEFATTNFHVASVAAELVELLQQLATQYLCEVCNNTGLISSGAPGDVDMCDACSYYGLLDINKELRKQLAAQQSAVELFACMQEPLRWAMRQARPSPDVPCNVDVHWRTGVDTVAAMLEVIDDAMQAREDEK